jgi:hypothetical protein
MAWIRDLAQPNDARPPAPARRLNIVQIFMVAASGILLLFKGFKRQPER